MLSILEKVLLSLRFILIEIGLFFSSLMWFNDHFKLIFIFSTVGYAFLELSVQYLQSKSLLKMVKAENAKALKDMDEHIEYYREIIDQIMKEHNNF